MQLILQLKGMEYTSPNINGMEPVTGGGGSAVVSTNGALVQVQVRIPVKLNSDYGVCEHHFRKGR